MNAYPYASSTYDRRWKDNIREYKSERGLIISIADNIASGYEIYINGLKVQDTEGLRALGNLVLGSLADKRGS